MKNYTLPPPSSPEIQLISPGNLVFNKPVRWLLYTSRTGIISMEGQDTILLTSFWCLYLNVKSFSSSFKDSDWLQLGHMSHSWTNHCGWQNEALWLASSGSHALLPGQKDGVLWLTAMWIIYRIQRGVVPPKEVAGTHAGHVIPGMPESGFSSSHSFSLKSPYLKRQRQITSQLH